VSETGTGGACADGTALDGVRSVTVSPDGTSVYAASETSGAVSVFSRDAATGALTQLGGLGGCVSQTGTGGSCADGRALGGAGDMTVTPDGANVYVASLGSDAVAVLSRDGTTGALTQLPGTGGCVSETGSSGACVDGMALDRSRSVVVSSDGTSVYVAAEISDAIAVFSRDATTGAITQLAGSAGCVSETGTAGACADGTALDGARSVAVSPDGKSAYAASFYSSAVSLFSRDGTTGALTQLGGSPPPPPPPPQDPTLSLSLRDAATVGGVAAANEDVLSFDGTTGFTTSFDGSDVGLSTLRIDAFARLDADSLLLSFDAPGSVPGIAGTVDDSDIVRFDATSLGTATSGTFGLYFDGSDVGLTANAHDVDAVELLTDGRLLLSTTGTAIVSGATARDEDLLAFTPTSLGAVTAGGFSLSFDGSDVGLGDAGEDIDAAAAAADASGHIYLSTLDVFAVPGITGADEDVFVFSPTALDPPTTAGTFASTLFFDGSSFGLGANDVFAIDVP
jgi:6-phosphogluconolactonase (cycloisomerase 2 family)